MATLGTFYTYYKYSGSNTPRSADNGGDFRFYFVVSETVNNSANTSTITTKHYCQTQSFQYLSWAYTRAKCAGTTKTVNASPGVGSGSIVTLIGTTTHTVSHNADGTGSCSWQGSGNNNDTGYIYTSSRTLSLTTIPRYATITTFIAAATGLQSIAVTWGADVSCDAIQYSLNGGAWTNASGYPTFSINGLSPGTQYSIAIRVKRTDSQLWTTSSTIYATTTQIAQITSGTPNFTIGSSVSVSFSNPSGATTNLRIETLNPTTNRITRNGVTSPYTFQFTPEEIALLYSCTPNSNSLTIRVVVDTNYNGSTYCNWVDGIASVSSSNPIFTSFAYLDTNPSVIAVTGSNQYIVRNQSTLRVVISSSNKMVAQNSATPINYIISCDNLTTTKVYSTGDINADLGMITTSGTKRISVKATDSRGNSTTIYIDIIVYDYAPPEVTAVAPRLNDFENQTTLSVSGIFNLLTIAGVNKNTIASNGAKYRYAIVGNDLPSTWTNLNISLIDNTFICTNVVMNLDNQSAFYFEIKVEDKLIPTIVSLTVDVGQELMYLNSETGDLEVKGNFKTGDKFLLKSGNEVLDYTVIASW